MENASKALLIAGAILLVIAIIAIGMTILGQGQDVVDQTGGQIGTMAITAHNSQFGNDLYDDAIISGKELQTIATTAKSNNNKNSSERVELVSVMVDTKLVVTRDATTENGKIGDINVKNDYKITLDYSDNGALKSITAVTN